MDIKELQAHVGRINTANGWRSRPPVPGGEVDRQVAVLALIGTEVSEAIEEIRNGFDVDETYYLYNDGGFAPRKSADGTLRKPEGVPSELADVVIRALDFADLYGIDLAAALEEKLAYNATRGHRHGDKTL